MSEASTRNFFFTSSDLSMLGGDGSCDVLNSLSSDAEAPVLHGSGPEGFLSEQHFLSLISRSLSRFAEYRVFECYGNTLHC